MPTTPHAAGTFDVTLSPQPASSPTPGAALGRMLLDKRYHGDLDGTAQGQMLSAGTVTTGSAGYVAIEHVVGRLHGKSGSFVLQHHGLMNRGAPQLSIIVVPDSGTGELLGLAGTMGIRIAEGKHFYTFDYTLP
jgi:Protein of unknown function (DUF3224)